MVSENGGKGEFVVCCAVCEQELGRWPIGAPGPIRHSLCACKPAIIYPEEPAADAAELAELRDALRAQAERPFVGSYCDEDDDCRTQFARDLCEQFGIAFTAPSQPASTGE